MRRWCIVEDLWRNGRVAEGAPLLRAYTLIAYRGFESLFLRQKQSLASQMRGIFFAGDRRVRPLVVRQNALHFGRRRRSAGPNSRLQSAIYQSLSLPKACHSPLKAYFSLRQKHATHHRCGGGGTLHYQKADSG